MKFGIRDEIDEAVEICEKYAQEYFEEDTSFTQVTKWQDGDFAVLVHHGMGYGEEDHPLTREYEVIRYKHFDGKIVYAKKRDNVDHFYREILESEIIADLSHGEKGQSGTPD